MNIILFMIYILKFNIVIYHFSNNYIRTKHILIISFLLTAHNYNYMFVYNIYYK